MTRKEFILHVGVLLLIVSGISGLLKTISNPNPSASKLDNSFGNGPYGG